MHSVLALVTAGLVRSNGITATIQHDAGEHGASRLPPSCDLSGRGPFDRLFEPEILPGAPGQLRALALSNRVTVPDAFVVKPLITAGLQFGVQRSTINQPDNQGVAAYHWGNDPCWGDWYITKDVSSVSTYRTAS